MNKNKFIKGDKVMTDFDDNIYVVYGVYSSEEVSLALLDYPDTEQDYLTCIDCLTRIKL